MMTLEMKASIRKLMTFLKAGSSEDLLFERTLQLPEVKIAVTNIKVIKE